MLTALNLPGPKGNISLDYPTGEEGSLFDKFITPASIINEALKYLFPFAGIILFLIFISAGFNMLTAAGNEEKVKKAQGQLTSAILGFVILIISYWLIKLVEYLFGVCILSASCNI